GILNEIGNLLEPEIAILLVGERPGLTTANSLSAYLAYKPNIGQDDANRNLISNIHGNGVGIKEASVRIMALAQSMRSAKTGGITIKETLTLVKSPND
ncbi:MAG: ethanolamine ammonia-lyase light chain EutC, partial [Planctomycetota bacterium]